MLKVKLFDEQHEEDLEEVMNAFLAELADNCVKDIHYQVAVAIEDEEEQVFCFSAMIIYENKNA